MFELTILFGSLACIGSFLAASARERRAAQAACDAATTDNHFSLLLESIDVGADMSGDALRQLGACQWRRL